MFSSTTAVGRRLVLIDIENVAGGAIMTCQQVRDIQASLTEALALNDRVDHIVVACGRASAKYAGFAWNGSRRFVFRPGIDGADLELLEILETESIASRYSDVTLVSGDAIFTNVVSALAGEAVAVTVAARPDAFSRRLRMAASRTVDLHFGVDQILEAA